MYQRSQSAHDAVNKRLANQEAKKRDDKYKKNKVIILGYPSATQYQPTESLLLNSIGNLVRRKRIKRIGKKLNSKQDINIFTRSSSSLSTKEALFCIGILIILGVVSANIILSGNGSSLLDLFKSL